MISGKRIIVFALLQVFCLLAAPPGKQASSEGEAPGATNPEERLEALARQAELARREGELAAELLDWDVKTESARQEQAQLLLEIQQAEFSLAGAEAGLEESRSRLDEGLEDLGWWVNYLYRYGHGSFLEVILGAKSFSEFIERAGLVFTIISAQAELVEEVRERAARLEAQLEALRQARALLDQKKLPWPAGSRIWTTTRQVGRRFSRNSGSSPPAWLRKLLRRKPSFSVPWIPCSICYSTWIPCPGTA